MPTAADVNPTWAMHLVWNKARPGGVHTIDDICMPCPLQGLCDAVVCHEKLITLTWDIVWNTLSATLVPLIVKI